VRPFVRSKNSTYVNRYKPISKLPRASKTTIDIITAVCSHSITRHSPQMEPDSVASDSCTNSLMALRSEGRVICESFAMSSVRSIMHRPLTQTIAYGVSHCLLPPSHFTIHIGLMDLVFSWISATIYRDQTDQTSFKLYPLSTQTSLIWASVRVL
jgi:hypothetical protein